MATKFHSLPKTLKMKELPVESIKLNAHPLSRIIETILPELSENFENVSAEVVQCPDLTKPPFNLASEGLSGDENVFDIGDVINIVPEIKREKLYDLKDLQKIVRSDPLIIMGPCAGPYPFIGADSECVANVKITGDRNNCEVKNGTHVLTTDDTIGECTHSVLPDDETRFSMMANLFTSQGRKGEVDTPTCTTE